MRLSTKWLKQYVDISGVTAQELGELLTSAGLEVEGIESLAKANNLVIGKVLSCSSHPDSDHLHVCQVDLGSEITQIVCGAPNVAADQKVIVAKVGAVLPELTIKESLIRGIASSGMICSLLELGVDAKYLREDQKNGIEVLADLAVVGEDPLVFLGLDDVILDVGLTPNRNDCLAMFSFAKEVGAILEKEVTLPVAASHVEAKTLLKVGSESDRCNLFLGKYIGSVTIKDSPSWMKERLMAAGIKSINNVVDISNYVMLETGQPLHFYDSSKIINQEITVKDGLEVTYLALDGNEYQVVPTDIMITSGGKCSGIAGVMGGEDSKIEDHTTSIVIEVASFHPVSIRNTSRRLNLVSEASMRYQKGIEPLAPYKAMARAVDLLVELADATLLEETVEFKKTDYTPKVIELTLAFLNKRLGTSFSLEEIMSVFTRLEFQPVVEGEMLRVEIPSYRTDLFIPDDLSEEVIRILGYDRLVSTLPTTEMTLGGLSERQQKRRMMERALQGHGLQQVITYTLVSESSLQRAVLPLGEVVRLASPMSEERKYVRSSLLPSMLESVQYNLAHSNQDVNIFEFSNVYANQNVNERLGIVLSGQLQSLAWKKQVIGGDFYALKGIMEGLLEKLGFDASRLFFKENTVDTINFHQKQSAALYLGRDLVGVFGVIHPSIRKSYDIKQGVMGEFDVDVLMKAKASKVKFAALPKYPSIKRDVAIVVDRKMESKQIVDVIKKAGKALVKDVLIFDVYEGEHVASHEKSIALSIVYHSLEKTLTDQEIGGLHETIVQALQKDCSAQLRS